MPTPPKIQVLIVYYSRFGVLKLLADCVAEGARRVQGVDVHFVAVEDQPVEEPRPGESDADMIARRAARVNRLTGADALVVGAPAYFGGSHPSGAEG